MQSILNFLNGIPSIISVMLGIIGYLIIKKLLPSYFSEKGKNLATKEDIEEITEKIKSVETKIKIKESSKIEYDALKRKTILEYFGTLNSWQNVLLDMDSDISSNCDYHNSIKIQKIEDIYLEYNIKQGEADIFIDDNKFYELRKEATISVLELQNEFKMHCHNIKGFYIYNKDDDSRREEIKQEKARYREYMLDKLRNDIMPKRNELIKYLSEVIKNSFE